MNSCRQDAPFELFGSGDSPSALDLQTIHFGAILACVYVTPVLDSNSFRVIWRNLGVRLGLKGSSDGTGTNRSRTSPTTALPRSTHNRSSTSVCVCLRNRRHRQELHSFGLLQRRTCCASVVARVRHGCRLARWALPVHAYSIKAAWLPLTVTKARLKVVASIQRKLRATPALAMPSYARASALTHLSILTAEEHSLMVKAGSFPCASVTNPGLLRPVTIALHKHVLMAGFRLSPMSAT